MSVADDNYMFDDESVGAILDRPVDLVPVSAHPVHLISEDTVVDGPAARRMVGGDHYLDWGMGYILGRAINYIVRAGRKGDRLEDLEKARHMLDLEIERCKR